MAGKTLQLIVEGFICSGCATDAENILRDTEGILAVTVTYATGKIDIQYDPSELDEKQIFSQVTNLRLGTRVLMAP